MFIIVEYTFKHNISHTTVALGIPNEGANRDGCSLWSPFTSGRVYQARRADVYVAEFAFCGCKDRAFWVNNQIFCLFYPFFLFNSEKMLTFAPFIHQRHQKK